MKFGFFAPGEALVYSTERNANYVKDRGDRKDLTSALIRRYSGTYKAQEAPAST